MLDKDILTMIDLTVGNMFDQSLDPLQDLKTLKLQESGWIIKLCNIKQDSIVLDYGAGFGFIANEISKVAKKVYIYNVDKLFIDYCSNLDLETYNNQPVDWTIRKDVIENVTGDYFDDVLKKLDTKKLFFNYYNSKLFADNSAPGKTFSFKQIETLAKKHKYKVLLHEKNLEKCKVLLLKIEDYSPN